MSGENPSTPSERLQGLSPSGLLRLGLASPRLAPTLEIPGYELLESLGSGGMGEVFRARQQSLDREVAVKVLRGELASGGWIPERFEREAQTMAALRHPHVVTVHDCLRLDDGRVAIVMEFVRGGTLRHKLPPDGLPLAQVLRWTCEIAEGLRAAHVAGVVHRDVKPENVLIDEHDSARVTDFGLAFSATPDATRYTQTGTALGTLGYMAPEQFRGGPVDVRTDVFSLAVIVYEMLTGRLPQGSFRPARALRPEVPVGLDALILASLRPEPELRPADMDEFLDRLDTVEAQLSPLMLGRRRMLVGAAAAGFAGIAGATWWLQSKKPEPVDETAWIRIPWPADPAEKAILGGWKAEDSALVSDDQVCILPLMPSLPSSWATRMRFRRMSGMHSLAVFFKTPLGMGTFTLASWGKNLGGVQVIGGKTLEQNGGFLLELENGRSYEWTVEYRDGRTRMWVDGELKQERDISGEMLTVAQPWEWAPDPATPDLLIGSWRSSVRFEWVEWRRLADR